MWMNSAASPWFAARTAELQADDLVLLVTPDQKSYLLSLEAGRFLHTHRGQFNHDDVIGQRIGGTVQSQIGHAALLMEPSLTDLMNNIRRGTQVIYPKDAAYLVHRLSLRAGSRVIEAGTGSGGLTLALAWAVAPTGRVYTYEMREDVHALARKNLEHCQLLPFVELFNRSIADGFQQSNVDALFLDVREPWQFLPQVHAALRPSGFFASLLPTANQVSMLLNAFEHERFASVTVEELLLRRYKAVPDRLRPEDEMVAHTGYLVFARTVDASVDPAHWLSRDRKRYRARQYAKDQIAAEEERRTQEIAAGGRKYPRMPLP